ncbi:iron-containing alcohol dehydrogenase [Actomonas aquatica]|uniref:Iron-containing alcohol dehydrogenase n=1 Tax=Actomonas aquatica TaxID=2866162 RepID=A0ABZ1C993_9BACT|nr:iron-containing alcohol dehydrogenase [Opitutus sp. WL0086]WRQ88271.1 iron-containing alcohol dehydrogenase [Opitutus sp. WL0086]
MSAASSLTFRQPPQISLGPNVAASALESWVRGPYRRLWVLTAPPVLALAEQVLAPWREAGAAIEIVTDLAAEPTTAQCEALRARATRFAPDLVIGLGGGSVLDVAKVVAALHDRTEPATDFYGINVLEARRTKLICIPTTAGTGSEVSPNSLLFDDATQTKKAIISPALIPDAAIVDAALMTGLPPSFTATTGIDALAHCLEAYASRNAHPTVDLWALAGVALVGEKLLTAVNHGNDLAARHALATASLYGGLSLGPVNTNGVHALAYPLSGALHLAHGISIALMLPAVVAFNVPAQPTRFAALARALGADPDHCADDATTAAQLPDLLTRLITASGIQLGLRHHGVTAAMIPTLADEALLVTRLLQNNPRPVTRDDAIAIYQAAFEA